MSEDPAELFRAALEEHARAMPDDEWRLFVAKTRPPDYSSYADPADRSRAVLNDIAAKRLAAQQRPRPEPPTKAAMDELDARISAAEASGNHTLAIALKRQKHAEIKKGTPR